MRKRDINKKILYIVISLLVILTLITTYFIVIYDPGEIIGSQSVGYVDKHIYGDLNNSKIKIAVISGMHPRENLSEEVLPKVSKYYKSDDVAIVNYRVIVEKSPMDFNIGRSNGESIVRDIIVPDLSKNDYNLVIIGHDHEPGYGEGFYITTPNMDSKSVQLAEKVFSYLNNSDLKEFNYYQRNTSKRIQSSSILGVNKFIIGTGTPLFVYEVPEWYSFDESYKYSYGLLENSVTVLKN